MRKSLKTSAIASLVLMASPTAAQVAELSFPVEVANENGKHVGRFDVVVHCGTEWLDVQLTYKPLTSGKIVVLQPHGRWNAPNTAVFVTLGLFGEEQVTTSADNNNPFKAHIYFEGPRIQHDKNADMLRCAAYLKGIDWVGSADGFFKAGRLSARLVIDDNNESYNVFLRIDTDTAQFLRFRPKCGAAMGF